MKNTIHKHSDSFKTEVVLEVLKVLNTLAEFALEYQLSPAQISTWKAEFLTNSYKTRVCVPVSHYRCA
jgi:transposase